MEDEILFSGAGGSAYVKVSARTGSAGNVGGQAKVKGKVAPPKVRKRTVKAKVDPDEPRKRKSPVDSDNPQPNDGGEDRGANFRRTTSRRGLAGRTGRRLRRAE